MADYASLLRDHVTLKCRSLDRIFLQAYLPKLQSVGQVCTFLRWVKGFKIPSSAAFHRMGEAYVQAIHNFAKEGKIPVVGLVALDLQLPNDISQNSPLTRAWRRLDRARTRRPGP